MSGLINKEFMGLILLFFSSHIPGTGLVRVDNNNNYYSSFFPLFGFSEFEIQILRKIAPKRIKKDAS